VITFNFMTEENIEERNIPEMDRKTINKAGNRFNHDLLGPELSQTDVPMIVTPSTSALARLEESLQKPQNQMQECVRIFSTRNFHLNYFSDSQDMDATRAIVDHNVS
jgi:hypothetical protein